MDGRTSFKHDVNGPSLSSRVSVALDAPTLWGLIHLRFSESYHFWKSRAFIVITRNILDSFSDWRASIQVMVGECHPKKIQCMLGALQSAFSEPAFLPKGGDALKRPSLSLCFPRHSSTPGACCGSRHRFLISSSDPSLRLRLRSRLLRHLTPLTFTPT